MQGDVHFARVVAAMGARVESGDDWIESAGRPPLAPFDLDFNHIPDAAMTAAVLALFATGPCTLRNIASWRVKETDRIAAMATELRKFGATVEEGPDCLRVAPPTEFLAPRSADLRPRGGRHLRRPPHGDVLLARRRSARVPVRINDPGCVAKTFPGYFDAFRAPASS